MAKITVSAHEHRYNGTPEPALARSYAKQPFTNGDNQSVSAGDIYSDNYVAEVAVTYADGVAQIASFSGDNRLDSTIIPATGRVKSFYTLTLHDANGNYLETVYDNIKIPESPTTTTWAELARVAEAATIPYRAEYYNREQIDELLSDLSVASNATDVIIGKARLSTTPEALADPIAIGDNDTRVVDNLANYGGSLSAAVTAIGVTKKVLTISENVNVAATLNIPQNITLDFATTGKITVASGQTLTVRSLRSPGNRQIFDGDGSVIYAKGSVEEVNIAWRSGIVSGTDITDALNEALTSVNSTGGRIYIPPGQWYSSGEHNIATGVFIRGAGKSPSYGQPNGTTITLQDPTGSYLFKIGENVFSTGIEDIILDGTGTTGKTGLLFEGTGSAVTTSADWFGFRYTIQNFDIGINVNSLGASWQMAQMLSIQGIFVGCNTAVRFSTVNHQWTSISTNFGVNPDGVAFDIVASGAVTIRGAEFAGTLRTKTFLDANVNTGTDVITITAHGFDDEAPVYVTSSGVIPTAAPTLTGLMYVLVQDANTIKLSATPGGAAVNITSAAGGGTHTLTNPSSKVMTISGSHGAINFDSVQDEAFLSFIENDASDIDGIINITHGSLIQSKILLNESCQVNVSQSILGSHAFQGAPDLAYVSVRDCSIREVSVVTGLTISPAVVSQMTDGGIVAVENISVLGNHSVRLPQRDISPLIALGAPETPVRSIGHITNGTNEDKRLLRLGRMTTAEEFDFYYDIYRRHSTGGLYFVGNQALPNRYFDFNAPIKTTDDAYNATNWNGSLEVPTKNATRDEIESVKTSLTSGLNLKANLSGAAFSGGITGTTAGFSGAVTNGTLAVGAGTTLTKILKGSVTIDAASVAATTFSSQTFTLAGAVVGDSLTLNPPAAGLTSGIIIASYFVSAADTITVNFYNTTGGAIDLASASWTYAIIRS